MDMIDDILFVHPNDMQQGRIAIQDTDITTNLPYIPGVYLASDHHQSEVNRAGEELADNQIIDANAQSAAPVVCDYYGGKERFPNIDEALDGSGGTIRFGSVQHGRSRQPDGLAAAQFHDGPSHRPGHLLG